MGDVQAAVHSPSTIPRPLFSPLLSLPFSRLPAGGDAVDASTEVRPGAQTAPLTSTGSDFFVSLAGRQTHGTSRRIFACSGRISSTPRRYFVVVRLSGSAASGAGSRLRHFCVRPLFCFCRFRAARFPTCPSAVFTSRARKYVVALGELYRRGTLPRRLPRRASHTHCLIGDCRSCRSAGPRGERGRARVASSSGALCPLVQSICVWLFPGIATSA